MTVSTLRINHTFAVIAISGRLMRILLVAAIFLGGLLSTDLRASQGELKTQGASTIPPQVIALASELLEGWKSDVTRAPAFYSVRIGRPIESARLGTPFREVYLRGSRLDEFLASPVNDPRQFASIEKYVFPILLSDGEAGALRVIRNRNDDDGKPLAEGAEDYVFGGYYLTGSLPPIRAQELRTRFPNASEITRLGFLDGGVPMQFLVHLPGGQDLLGQAADDLRPANSEFQVLRARVQSFRSSRPVQPNE